MLIWPWTIGILTLFKWQYSYDVQQLPMSKSHLDIVNGTLVSCIYPTDKPFKKGSPTFPRSELRSLEEFKGGNKHLFEVNMEKLPKGTDYSIWQVFGNGSPMLMIRHRKGRKEMVVFDGQPKIQPVDQFPVRCDVDCKGGVIQCGNYTSKGMLKCDKMYLKIGIYAQQVKPKEKMCAVYGKTRYGIKFNELD